MKKILTLLALAPLVAIANPADDFPSNPEPGKCYARTVAPATYSVASEQVLVKPESFTVKTTPAKFAYVNQEVVVKEATEKTVVVPAKFKKVREKIVLEEEKRLLVPTAPTYKVVKKKILVKPEGHEWKKGSGPIQKVDNATGEILCYTKTPAVYKTVEEKVLVNEAAVKETVVPAKFGWIEKTVLAEPEKVIKKPIPAVTKVLKVKKMVEPPKELKLKQPAQYKTVTKKTLATPSSTEWKSILCKTNTTTAKVAEIQKALSYRGHYKGPIDGIYGSQTLNAVTSFQRKNNFATGGLTEETLKKLNISL